MITNHEFYIFLSIFTTGGLFLACGLMFLFTVVPDNPLLGNYRKARYVMAAAYLFMVVVVIAEYLAGDSEICVPMMQAITLIFAVSQAFLFTLTLFALLEVRFPGWWYIFRRAAPAILIIIAVFSVYFFFGEDYFGKVFGLFCAMYALLLVRYTYLFMVCYRQFRLRMDNYFSDYEAGRMQWVAFSFFSALTIGVMALLTTVFMSGLVALIFTVLTDVFYVWFAIRFINYGYRFHVIELALDEKAETLQTEEPPVDNNHETDDNDPATFAKLEKQIEKWIAKKRFTQKGITIDVLASEFCTNRRYISSYFITCKKKMFREWINELRIKESKTLMLQQPDMTINEVALRVGFSDKSNLRRHFIRLTGENPQVWRSER